MTEFAANLFFGHGPVMTAEQKYCRIGMLSASLLTLFAIGCGSLGLWRVGTDLAWTEDFVIRNGFLSHWQVWIGAAITAQYISQRLARYAGSGTAASPTNAPSQACSR